jgi:hypothetical protein
MLKYFILAVLCLILYQFIGYVVEGLEGEADSMGESGTGDSGTGDSGTGDSGTGDNTSNTGSSNSNNNNCGMSLTDRNVFLLNDRVNSLQVQYTDLSSNIVLLNKQMEDLMKQNENAASDMVGNEPLDISTGGNDMPQEVGGDTTDTTDTTDTAAAVSTTTST